MSPILSPDDLDFISHGDEHTRILGEEMGRLVHPGDVIALRGALGSGKTRFVQGVARGMAVLGIVASPSYTIVNQYYTRDGLALNHVDFYRLAEGSFLGFDPAEVIGGTGVAFVEWPERAPDLIPEERLDVSFRHVDETKRGLIMQPTGERYRDLVRAFRLAVFGI